MYPILIIISIIAIDQFIKLQVINSVLPNGDITVIKNFFHIVYTENYGIAFGMLKNKTLFFIITTSIISAIILYLVVKFYRKNAFLTVCLCMILGGAVGNLIDRIRLGYVIDYLHFTIFPPVFNFADSAIVIGAIILSGMLLFNKEIKI